MKKIIAAICLLVIASLILGSVSYVATAATRTVSFGGYDWKVKSGHYGPGPNDWLADETGVFVEDDKLHLTVQEVDGDWYSSEVYLPKSLGYGTYRFETEGRVDAIDPNLVLGLFLYQDETHELDIEYSRWGYEDGKNASFAVQPYTKKGNHSQFSTNLKNASTINEIKWEKNKITFKISQGKKVVKEWVYKGKNNFKPGKERVHMNFWMMDGLAPQDRENAEIVVKNFSFKPLK